MSDQYEHSRHAKFLLQVHIILVTKYRKTLFVGGIADDVKNYMYEVSIRYGYSIICMETDSDHIHILLKYYPRDNVSDIVANLKQYSTFMLWKKYYSVLSCFYWKKHIIWSDGYFACSIGQVSQSVIENYIASQG